MGRVKVNRKIKDKGKRESLDEFALKCQLLTIDSPILNDHDCITASSFVFEFISFLNFLFTAVGSSYMKLPLPYEVQFITVIDRLQNQSLRNQ